MKKIVMLLLMSLSPLMVGAQQISVNAQVSESQVTAGQQFIYLVDVSANDMSTSLPEVQAPDFGGLTLLRKMGTTRSTSIQVFGGRQNASTVASTRYLLTAPSEGTFKIGPARVMFNGKTHESQPVVVQASRPQVAAIPGMSDGSVLPAQTNSPALTRQLSGRLFMKAEVDNPAPYQGQPVHVTYTVYTDIQPQSAAVDEWLYPQMAGLPNAEFQFADVYNLAPPQGQRPQRPPAREVQLEGRTFRAITVLDSFAVPMAAGSHKIGPYNVLARIPLQRQDDPFGFPSFFDTNTETAILPTLPIVIEVKPLPAEGRPAQATQIMIGDFRVSAELDRQAMSQDELAILRLRIEGRGNPASIPQPPASSLGSFDVFESKKEDLAGTVGADGLHGGRVYELFLRAKQPGQLTVPPIVFHAFNPWTQSYQELASPALSLQVNAPAAAPEVFSAQGSPLQSEAMKTVGDGMEYIETSGFRGSRRKMKPFEDPMIWALQAMPLVLIAGAYGARRRRQWLMANDTHVRRRAALGMAQRRLKKAESALRSGSADQFYSNLSNALRAFFADKLGRPATGLTLDDVRAEFLNRGVAAEMAEEAVALMESADSGRFAPASSDPGRMNECLERTRQMMVKANDAL